MGSDADAGVRRLTKTEWGYLVVVSVIIGLIAAAVIAAIIYTTPAWHQMMNQSQGVHALGNYTWKVG